MPSGPPSRSLVPLTVAEAAASTQNWPVHVIADSAHAPQIEQPERFTETLRMILAGA